MIHTQANNKGMNMVVRIKGRLHAAKYQKKDIFMYAK